MRAVSGTSASVQPCQAFVAVLIAVATTNLKLDVGHAWATPVGPSLAVVNLHCSLHLMSLHGSATADASVMAPSPFAVKKSVGMVGELEEVEGGGALSQEVVLLVVVLSPASPSPGGGAVGGGDVPAVVLGLVAASALVGSPATASELPAWTTGRAPADLEIKRDRLD